MRRTKADAEATRLKLLDAAEMLFYEKGTSSVTLDAIASTAGMTRGAIYWHFKSKADLLRALYDSMPMPAEDIFARAVRDQHDDPLTVITGVVRDALALIANDPRRQRIYSILFRCDFRGEFLTVLERERRTNLRQFNLLIELFEMAKGKRLLRSSSSPVTCAKTCHWMVIGLLFEWLRNPSAFDLVAECEEAMGTLMESFRPIPAPEHA